jgi:hypothetical protein
MPRVRLVFNADAIGPASMTVVRPLHTMTTRTIVQSHWIGFLFLLPFLIMLVVHDTLGLSDAFLFVSRLLKKSKVF